MLETRQGVLWLHWAKTCLSTAGFAGSLHTLAPKVIPITQKGRYLYHHEMHAVNTCPRGHHLQSLPIRAFSVAYILDIGAYYVVS
jgi:hypothetical protein